MASRVRWVESSELLGDVACLRCTEQLVGPKVLLECSPEN